jgi:NAD(P)-dependent dehydrogenase (short-subunit alcohol dehydrogenase family)
MKRIAVITGGAQGIGFAAARSFLQNGFSGVLLVDRNAAGLASAKKKLDGKGQVSILSIDLAEDGAAKLIASEVEKEFGQVDVLVNAAGNTERCGLEDTTPDTFYRLVDVNLKAPLFMMQAMAPLMKRQGQGGMGQGTIINISSMLAHGGPPVLATYAATKAGLVALTKSAANTWKREGIRVFAINLGWVNTDGEHALQTGFHQQPQDWAKHIGARMPSGRLIESDDAAGLIHYLTTPSAQMMTGAIIDYEQMPIGVYDEHPALGPV